MKIDKLQDRAIIELDLSELETYPAWQTTALCRVRVNNGDKWTDCWLSAINKNGRVRFVLNHEKGYPSENKGSITKALTASWLSVDLPKLS